MRRALAKLGLLEETRYNPARGYTPAKSDLYDFDPRDSIRVPLALGTGALALPAGAANVHSALLKVDVRSTLAGALMAPWIEFRVGEQAPVRHWLDKGSAGTKYLDVSELVSQSRAGNNVVDVTVRYAGLEATAELLLFDNEPAGEQRVLVLAAHPDDAEIAAFGLYKNSASAVVTLTAGDGGRPYYGHIVADTQRQYDLKQRLRVWDSLVVPFWGGVEPDHIANLGYFDCTLQSMHDERDRPAVSRTTGRTSMVGQRRSYGNKLLRPGATATWDSLVLDLVHILGTLAPSVVVTPHPLLDAHSDHRYTTLALFDALELTQARRVNLFLYVNHAPFCAHWPFGPPGNPASLPPWPLKPARVRGLYSQPLNDDDQIDKLFALESMHDLRRAPPSAIRGHEWGALSTIWEARDAFMRQRMGAFSFLRRGVRSREIFFVHPVDDITALRSDITEGPLLWQRGS